MVIKYFFKSRLIKYGNESKNMADATPARIWIKSWYIQYEQRYNNIVKNNIFVSLGKEYNFIPTPNTAYIPNKMFSLPTTLTMCFIILKVGSSIMESCLR